MMLLWAPAASAVFEKISTAQLWFSWYVLELKVVALVLIFHHKPKSMIVLYDFNLDSVLLN